MNLEIIPQAQSDIGEVAKYYRKQRLGLDNEFLEEVDAATKMIASDPLLFEQVRPGIRRCLLDRFPYGIFYRHSDAKTVRIVVVRQRRRRLISPPPRGEGPGEGRIPALRQSP